jgi:hypothetical protein
VAARRNSALGAIPVVGILLGGTPTNGERCTTGITPLLYLRKNAGRSAEPSGTETASSTTADEAQKLERVKMRLTKSFWQGFCEGYITSSIIFLPFILGILTGWFLAVYLYPLEESSCSTSSEHCIEILYNE